MEFNNDIDLNLSKIVGQSFEDLNIEDMKKSQPTEDVSVEGSPFVYTGALLGGAATGALSYVKC